MSRPRAGRLARLLILFAVVACPGDSGGPTQVAVPGLLSVVLHSPNSDDGGALITISGGPIDSVMAVAYRVRSTRLSPASFRVLVDGTLIPFTPVLRIAVPDVGLSSSYVATLEQVASRVTYAQRPTSSYTVTVGP